MKFFLSQCLHLFPDLCMSSFASETICVLMYSLGCFNGVAVHVFPKPLYTGYADHGISLKGRPPKSPDELQVQHLADTPYDKL